MEVSERSYERFLPHPILDDSEKMRRIIANPLYDQLTVSRAAYIRKLNPDGHARRSVRLSQSQDTPLVKPRKSLAIEQTTITPLFTNNSSMQSNPGSKYSNPSLSARRKSSLNDKRSTRSSSIDTDKKSLVDGTIQYINTPNGLEVRRYSSQNWLSVNLFTKDACQASDKTFREVLEKMEQEELLTRSVYTSDYYRQRWNELTQSCEQSTLTHSQWAERNYQLNCLKTLYQQALEQEQQRLCLHAQNQRRKRAKNAYKQWQKSKNGIDLQRRQSEWTTAVSRHSTPRSSVISNPLLSLPNVTTNRVYIPSVAEQEEELDELPLVRPLDSSKANSSMSTSNVSYPLDGQRWSIQAMLERVVGLAEPLPPPPKIINYRYVSPVTFNNDSDYEASPRNQQLFVNS